MRTSIFSNFTDLSKEFRDDFDVLWQLPAEARKGLIPQIPKVVKTRTTGEQKSATNAAVEESGANPADVFRAIRILLYIYSEWNPLHDTPQTFLTDLGELQLVPQEKAEEAKSFLLDFLAEVEKDNDYRLEKSFAESLLPTFKQCATVIDLRAVIRNPYGSAFENKIQEYEPTCIGFAPVVVVRLSRDTSDAKSFLFQCEEDALQNLIDSLSAALKDLKAAKRSLPGGM